MFTRCWYGMKVFQFPTETCHVRGQETLQGVCSHGGWGVSCGDSQFPEGHHFFLTCVPGRAEAWDGKGAWVGAKAGLVAGPPGVGIRPPWWDLQWSTVCSVAHSLCPG